MIELKNNPAGNFFLIAGPCVIEGEEMALRIAERIVGITEKLQIPYVFKGSYRKANRSRLDSFMGIGDEKALKILKKVHDTFGVPTVTDIHAADEAEMAAEYVDILQIPAFLCRQTDLLIAAAKTGKTINIKKGQFLSPLAMRFAAEKVIEAGNKHVMLTERGTTFGYQDLVIDYRGIPEMQSFGFPVILDATHSLQQPNQASGVTGGMPQLIETVAKAGIAAKTLSTIGSRSRPNSLYPSNFLAASPSKKSVALKAAVAISAPGIFPVKNKVGITKAPTNLEAVNKLGMYVFLFFRLSLNNFSKSLSGIIRPPLSIYYNRYIFFTQIGKGCGYCSSTSSSSACLGYAGATFPYSHSDFISREYLSKLNIYSVGE